MRGILKWLQGIVFNYFYKKEKSAFSWKYEMPV